MLFNSYEFVLLVIVTFLIYYIKAFKNFQIYILITSSFIFYAYNQPILLLLLFISASINAITSYKVFYTNQFKKKKLYSIIGVSVNLLVLIFFKYSPLFGNIIKNYFNINDFSEFLILIPLPIGISFYTFQGISLVVDLYRSKHQKECSLFNINKNFKKHYIDTLFFISFFPQLVAGPIVKAYQFYPQIKMKELTNIDINSAFKLITIGYFLKMVIADNLKDQTFWITYPYFEAYNSFSLIVILFGFSIQIFSDFAGYSLIAIGIAKLFGYNLPKNFNFPYISKSFSEFWNRWHISLSTWLKEYLYFSLGGNRKGQLRTYFNLLIVMALGGLWHGASLSYMAWGVYHGLLLAIERYFVQFIKFKKNILIDILKTIFVFSFVTYGWLFFKLTDFNEVILYTKNIFIDTDGILHIQPIVMIFFYSLPITLYYFNYLIRKKINKNLLDNYLTYGILIFFIITSSGSSDEFIYFQF